MKVDGGDEMALKELAEQSCKSTYCAGCLCSPPVFNFEWLSHGENPVAGWSSERKLCGGCFKSEVAEAAPFVQRYEAALAAAKNLRTWSINYKGHVPRKWVCDPSELGGVRRRTLPREPERVLASDWWREKDSAEWQLKVTAAYLGHDSVIELRCEKCTGSEPGYGNGTHYYTQWRARGIGCVS